MTNYAAEIALAQRMWPAVARRNIATNVPHIVEGLRRFYIADGDMLRVAFATVGVETPWQPVTEYISHLNDRGGPPDYDRYDTRADLGNTPERDGDGARYCGRGYVQLTGRRNYREIGRLIGVDLEAQPEFANQPGIAGLILGAFLARCEKPMRDALARGDLATCRRLVNGGSHGLQRFIQAMERANAAADRAG
jgi:hypothetical protein